MRLFVGSLMIAGVVLSSSAALAQQAAQTPEQQAMANKLMAEISGGLQCQAALITAQKDLEELRKKHEKDNANAPPSPPK